MSNDRDPIEETLFIALLIIVITGLRAFNTLRRNYHRRKKIRFITVYQKTTYEELCKLMAEADLQKAKIEKLHLDSEKLSKALED